MIWCSPTSPPPLEHTGFPWYLLAGTALECSCWRQGLSQTQMQSSDAILLGSWTLSLILHAHTSEKKWRKKDTKETERSVCLRNVGPYLPTEKAAIWGFQTIWHYFWIVCFCVFEPLLQTECHFLIHMPKPNTSKCNCHLERGWEVIQLKWAEPNSITQMSFQKEDFQHVWIYWANETGQKKKKERKNMASKILRFITYCSDILFVL